MRTLLIRIIASRTLSYPKRQIVAMASVSSPLLQPPKQFYRRTLPESCVSFCSEDGKVIFKEALLSGHMNNYFSLASQFRTQDEPAFCGLSTLVMVLNALEIDPGRVWKGPWRWYHENMLECCTPLKIVEKDGITMDQFACLALCNTLNTRTIYVNEGAKLEDFRWVVETCTKNEGEIVAVSYSRKVIGQTGDGHFSPIGGYHKEKDLVLIMDTARFKYPPHWVKLPLLFEAMKSLDHATGLPRGYFILSKSTFHPQLLFEVSSDLSVTAVSDAKAEVTCKLIDGIKAWSSWLQEKSDPDRGQLTLAKAVDILSSCLPAEELLTIKCTAQCSSVMSPEHTCALREIIKLLEALPVYQDVLSLLGSSGAVGVLCARSEMPITTCHCITMALISWPYDTCVSGSHASFLNGIVSKNSDEIKCALANEVSGMRRVLNSILGYIHKCQDCSCSPNPKCYHASCVN